VADEELVRPELPAVIDRLVRGLVAELPGPVIDDRAGSVPLRAVVTLREVPGWRSLQHDLERLAARLLDEPPIQGVVVLPAKPMLVDQILHVLEVRVAAATGRVIVPALRTVLDDLVSWSVPAEAVTSLDVVVAEEALSWSGPETGTLERAERARRRRVSSDLEGSDRDRRLVLRWCDASTTGRIVAEDREGAPIAWVSVEELPEHRASCRHEDGRRLAMVGVARVAATIAERLTGASRVTREGSPDAPLSACEGEAYAGWDWRFDPDRTADPLSEEVRTWWEANRGPLSVRCNLHGEIARVDASASPAILAPAWDAAVVEYHQRWERSWILSSDDPDSVEHCSVRIESTTDPGGANLLDVVQMWIVLEGAGRPWWAYELFPEAA
jgi:hypothetical protein